jgi:hypothetical protein
VPLRAPDRNSRLAAGANELTRDESIRLRQPKIDSRTEIDRPPDSLSYLYLLTAEGGVMPFIRSSVAARL